MPYFVRFFFYLILDCFQYAVNPSVPSSVSTAASNGYLYNCSTPLVYATAVILDSCINFPPSSWVLGTPMLFPSGFSNVLSGKFVMSSDGGTWFSYLSPNCTGEVRSAFYTAGQLSNQCIVYGPSRGSVVSLRLNTTFNFTSAPKVSTAVRIQDNIVFALMATSILLCLFR